MKKIVAYTFLFSIVSALRGQVSCIFCFDQNDSISSGVTNFIFNGGFEHSTCSIYDGICPLSSSYECDILNWTATGGGPDTYACIVNFSFGEIVEGNKAVYFGNSYAEPCSEMFDDLSCLNSIGCELDGVPEGFPVNDTSYGYNVGFSIEQIVEDLSIGSIYILEFWAGGEDGDYFEENGLFGVDVGFGNIMLSCKPTDNTEIGTRYLIVFNATSTSHKIKFTNWGHICTLCTELLLDNVRLYTPADLPDYVPYPHVYAGDDVQICGGDTIQLQASGAEYYLWSPGLDLNDSTIANPMAIVDSTAIYVVTGFDVQGCADKDSIMITSYSLPAVEATADTYTIDKTIGESSHLHAETGITFSWQPVEGLSCTECPDPVATPEHTTIYEVSATDANGCKNSDTVTVHVIGNLEVALPNAFSPNEDGFNDTYLPIIIGNVVIDNFSIYNRWGKLVFFSDSVLIGWNGKINNTDAEVGNYVIKVNAHSAFETKEYHRGFVLVR